ncbi:S-adenosylmethionine mitochondrial carrier protein homolog isoform X2 [Orussus abietinus]|nr:S-adenosylmethionine mitochondrial carrier protein homolog isoform X2 [Orussus abietinus]
MCITYVQDMLNEEAKPIHGTVRRNLLINTLIAGGVAGTICDLVFFPLDTLKTRLQSQHGFVKSGGFKRLYCGLTPVLVGSGSSSSVFFVTYEAIKDITQPCLSKEYHVFVHMSAASVAELISCLIRVPMEVLKQRRQALLADSTHLSGRTLYRGYGSTVLRDLPFSIIQMPLWEYFKLRWKQNVNRECTPFESAFCGLASVAISGAITTPLDVAKTRIMLSCTSAAKEEVKISTMLKEVYNESGVRG